MRISVHSLMFVAVMLCASSVYAQLGGPGMGPGGMMPGDPAMGGMPGMPGMPGMGMPGMPGMGMQGVDMQNMPKFEDEVLEPTYQPGKGLPWLATDLSSTTTDLEKNPPSLSTEAHLSAERIAISGLPPTAAVSLPSPSDVNVFFYRELEEGSVLREKLRRDEYDRLKENAVLSLMMKGLADAQQQAQASQQQAGSALQNSQNWEQVQRTSGGRYNPEVTKARDAASVASMKAQLQTRAAQDYYTLYNTANWDFFFQQKELYYRYLRDTVFAGYEGELPEPSYSTVGADTETKNFKTQMETVQQDYATQERNQILDFFDRLEKREDNRRSYVAWNEDEKQRVVEQATEVARRYNARTWNQQAASTTNDDWYRSRNAASPAGIAVVVGGQDYVYSTESPENVAVKPGQVAVQSTTMTPYDYVARDGSRVRAAKPKTAVQLPNDIPTGRSYDLLNSE